MHMTEFHGTGKLVVSFELYPPKTPEAEAKLFDRAIPALLDLSPAFWTLRRALPGRSSFTTA